MRGCQEIRDRLVRQAAAAAGDADHMSGCASCRGFAARLEALRGGLRAHHARLEPDLAFAARVRARLSGDASAALGLAALRLLPVTATLLLILLGFSLASMLSATANSAADSATVAGRDTAGDETSPEEQWVAWVLQPESEATP